MDKNPSVTVLTREELQKAEAAKQASAGAAPKTQQETAQELISQKLQHLQQVNLNSSGDMNRVLKVVP
jgi:hypothetical protein